jgi:DNA-binding transcriptional regulator YiaG
VRLDYLFLAAIALVDAKVLDATDKDLVAMYAKAAEARAKGYLETRRAGRPAKVETEHVKELLRQHGKVTQERMAELLSCDLKSVANWAERTSWGTWTKARAALLAQIQNR